MSGSFYHRLRFFPLLLLVSLSFFLYTSPVFSAQIGLAWDPNSESDLAGYKVYFGTASRAYGAPINVGNVTAYTLTGLTSGQTYYIAVTAYDTSNNESGFSNEVNGAAVDPIQTYTYTLTTSPSGLQIAVDGTACNAPQTFSWAGGSSHTVSVPSPQGGTGTRYVFSSWSDGGVQSHTITVPSSNTTYTANFTTQYSLTTAVNPSGAGTVSPSGANWYNSGQSISVSATANGGFSFTNWTGDLTGSTNPSPLTMSGPKSVTGNFAVIPETVSSPTAPTGPTNGSTGAGYSYSTGGAASNLGHTVAYQFDWKGDGTDLSSWGSSTQSKTWTVAGVYQVRARARCTIDTGAVSGWSNILSVTISQATVSCTVATIPSGLQVAVDGSTYTAPKALSWAPGSSHTVSVLSTQSGSAGTQYVFASWSDGGGQSHTITAPSSGTTYTVSFNTQYSLTTSTNPAVGGTVSPSGTVWYNSGQSVSVSATASTGYSFTSWTGDLTGSTNPSSLTMSGPKSVTASFTQNQYTLVVSINPAGSGSINRSPDKPTYVYGDQVALTATANSGYTFSGWTGDVTGTASPVTLTITGNKAVTVNFTATSETVSIPTRPTGSSIGVTGTSYSYSTGGSTSNLGHAVEYQFDWKGDGTDLSAWGSSSQSKIWTTAGSYQVRARARCTTDTSVVSNWSGGLSVSVTAAVVSCTVGTSPSGVQLLVDGSTYTSPQTFNWAPGSSHNLSVSSPQAGVTGTRYIFSSWSDGGSQSHTITVASSNTTYTANFATQYSLTTAVSPSNAGTVSPSGVNWYNSGQSVSVSATANGGYSFSSWSGDLAGSSNPSTLTMSGAKNVAATFTQQQPGRIALKAGPNLLSFPNLPGEVPLANLLSSISGQYDLVYAYEGCDQADPWKVYDPSLPASVNDLQNIDPTMGVWIEMTQDSELNVSGSYPPTLSIPLCAGWNLISYAGNQEKPITDALSSIADKYLKVYTYKASDPIDPWKIFDSSVPPFVNDLTMLEPGLGYWINVNQNCTLVINNN